MKYTYVASPLGAATYAGIQENIRRATSYCKWVWRSRHSIPVAPHIYFTCFMDDMDEADREVGTDEGLKLLARCDEMCVFAEDYEHASPGMQAEIKLAETLGIPVEYISWEDKEENFGALIRARRKELHMTQAELAAHVNVNVQTIRSYEAGKYFPKIKNLYGLQNILGIPYAGEGAR